MQAFFEFLTGLIGLVFFYYIIVYFFKIRDTSELKKLRKQVIDLQRELIVARQNQIQFSETMAKPIRVKAERIKDRDLTIEEDMVIVGVTFDNEDGTNRQDVIKRCKPGTRIELKRTPMRKYPNAIGVFCEYGQIGNISEDENEEIAEYMDKGGIIEYAEIKKITGGTKSKPTVGCVIKFTWYPQD